MMPELAQLIQEGSASTLLNIGNLVQPMMREQFRNKSKQRPAFLYAHNHQRRHVFSGHAHKLEQYGWAGRLADH